MVVGKCREVKSRRSSEMESQSQEAEVVEAIKSVVAENRWGMGWRTAVVNCGFRSCGRCLRGGKKGRTKGGEDEANANGKEGQA